MSEPSEPIDPAPPGAKEREASFASAAEEKELGLLAELWDFLLHSKKWWLTPIILALILLGILVLVGGSSLASFLYPLF